jgi:hypothetical protein
MAEAGDEQHPAAPFDPSFQFQLAHGLARGRPLDFEPCGPVRFGGQRLPRLDLAGQDLPRHHSAHRLAGSLSHERRDRVIVTDIGHRCFGVISIGHSGRPDTEIYGVCPQRPSVVSRCGSRLSAHRHGHARGPASWRGTPALMPGVSVCRRVAGAPASGWAAVASPLKILVAVGAPDEGKTPNSVLDLEHELQSILDAVEPRALQGNAEVRFLEIGHPQQINQALQHDAAQVLHQVMTGRAASSSKTKTAHRSSSVRANRAAAAGRAPQCAAGVSVELLWRNARRRGRRDGDRTGSRRRALRGRDAGRLH